MSTTIGRGTSKSRHLQATKEFLEDVNPGAYTASTTLDEPEAHVIERDTFEVLRLTRSQRNGLAPINRIPPEILALIPTFLEARDRDRDIITLTHVCQAWRDIFTSYSSFWAELDCKNADKTRVYLARSMSSPIDLRIWRNDDLSPNDPFFQIIPHAIPRLKSLAIRGSPEDLAEGTAQLSHPAPLLESLTIEMKSERLVLQWGHPIATTLFNGDLSSLRELCLDNIRTELPWRNMINLTSFTLRRTSPGDLSIGNLLDFIESAPNLYNIELHSIFPTSDAQNGRLVSLECLRSMAIEGGPPSLLLDHLLIPIGTELKTIGGRLSGDTAKDLLPSSLDNLRNLSGFIEIDLHVHGFLPRIEFIGPNGKLCLTPTNIHPDPTIPALVSLAEFDTSKAERLKIFGGYFPTEDYLYQALLPMENLRVLTLSRCKYVSNFVQGLRPGIGSSEVIVCPKLEELVIVLCTKGEAFDIKDVIGVVTARESGGAKLGTVRIVGGWGELDAWGVSELRKHVLHVEFGQYGLGEADGNSGDGCDSNDGDEGGDEDDESGDYIGEESSDNNEDD